MIGGLWQDLRYGLNSLSRSPTFTLSAVLTLALGIGASTTIFALFEAVMMRRLPVARPEELYFVAHGSPAGQGVGSNYPYFERVRSATSELAAVSAYDLRKDLKVSSGASVEITPGQYVSGNYHDVIGVPMLLGRGFTGEDDRVLDGPPTAVISEGYWARQFGRDPAVLGRTIVVNGRQAAIIGVTAPGFEGLDPGSRVDVTVTMAFRALDQPDFLTMHDTWTSMNIVARLRDGVTPERALPAFDAPFQQYFSEPDNAWLRRGEGARNFASAWLLPAEAGKDDLRERYARSLQVLLSMVGVLLVIACANVANLLLARGSVRSKEVALRMSIGAGRMRVARQFLVESIQLSLLAGAVGWVAAQVGVDAILALLAMGQNPILLEVEPNATVLAFTIGVSALTGISFGLAPAFGVTAVDLTQALKGMGRGTAIRRSVWSPRHALVVGQIALCVLLVYGAGLLGRTLHGLETKDGGFDGSNVLMFTVDASGTAFPGDGLPAFCDDLIERMRGRFGVQSGSCSTSVPVNTRGNARPLVVPGGRELSTAESLVFMNRISPEYFLTQGIDLAQGRVFDASDTDASERVAVISRSAARFFFGEEDPIGKRVHFFRAEQELMTIVGLVEDAVQWSLRDEPFMTVYTPLTQLVEPESDLTVSLRALGDPRELSGSVRAEVAALSPALVVDYVRTMDQQIDGTLVRERVLALLSSAFALLAIVLCCTGLYGVIAYDVSRRSRDLGIRLALGGQRAAVLGRVLAGAAVVSGLGLVLGLGAALASTRNLTDSPVAELLFEVQPRDPLTLVLAAALIVATSLLASYLPARRASRIDPAMVMKAE